MIPGFLAIDRHRFYSEVWPRICGKVEAVQSNLKRYRLTGALPLVIYWGHKGDIRDTTTIIAVSFSNGAHPDEYWIAPELISPQP